jgi:hypothetical protein
MIVSRSDFVRCAALRHRYGKLANGRRARIVLRSRHAETRTSMATRIA